MSDLRFAGGQIGARQLGDFKRPADKPVQTYPQGRKCACGWLLSMFNPGPECARCENPTPTEAEAA